MSLELDGWILAGFFWCFNEFVGFLRIFFLLFGRAGTFRWILQGSKDFKDPSGFSKWIEGSLTSEGKGQDFWSILGWCEGFSQEEEDFSGSFTSALGSARILKFKVNFLRILQDSWSALGFVKVSKYSGSLRKRFFQDSFRICFFRNTFACPKILEDRTALAAMAKDSSGSSCSSKDRQRPSRIVKSLLDSSRASHNPNILQDHQDIPLLYGIFQDLPPLTEI